MLEVPLHVLCQLLGAIKGARGILRINRVFPDDGTYFLLLLAFLGKALTLGEAENLREQLCLKSKG